jgi:uncharacterized protein YabE (DUF348 family)
LLKLKMPSLSRRTVRTAAQGVLAAALVAGTAAYATAYTTVDLTVDGRTEQVRSYGSTVADVLDAADVDVSKRDVVAPSLDSEIAEGGDVVVRHARALTLTVDGKTRTQWTTALTVGAALSDPTCAPTVPGCPPPAPPRSDARASSSACRTPRTSRCRWTARCCR